MGSINNRRLYAAALGIAAVGFVLDRTVFSDRPSGPEAARAELTPQAHAADAAAKPREPEPDRTAVHALVEKLKSIEQSGPVGPPARSDAFSLNNAASAPPDSVAAPDTADDSPAATFRRNHRLRTVLVIDGVSSVMVDNSVLTVGQELDGFVLVSVDARKGNGSAAFVSGSARVELIVPTGAGRPKSGGSGAPDSPPGS